MTESILRVRQLTKRFGKRVAVDNLDLDVRAGEIMGFLGPNGAGKTTTIKMIMGFLFEDEGTIIINGYNLREDYEKAMGQVGGIVENPEMYTNLSGRQNLELYANLHGIKDKAEIDRVIETVQMENRMDEKVKRYSLGMKQRVGLALALVHKPRVLILDEPTNGLDPAGIRHLRDILKHLAHTEGVAVLVSSHQLSEMELLCDRVTVIDQGRLIVVRNLKEDEDETDSTGEKVDNGLRVWTWLIEIPNTAALESRVWGDEILTPEIVDGQRLRVIANEQQLLQIQQALLTQGHPIRNLKREVANLEDTYLKLTEKSKIE